MTTIGCWCTMRRVRVWHQTELARLIDEVGNDDRGGLLAMPVTDTLKRGDDGQVVATLAARWALVRANAADVSVCVAARRT